MGDTADHDERADVNASPSSSHPAVDPPDCDDDMFEDAVEEADEDVPPEALSPKRFSRDDTKAPGHKGWVSAFEDPFYEDGNDTSGSLILNILKNVRPGQEFDHMLAPTQMLQSMSMLEKVSYLYFHGNVLFGIQHQESPELRFKQMVQWYCSWLYALPIGTRKPYNPVLGEIYRCKWDHGDDGVSHYIGEQVSHHPAISGFYFCNRKQNFVINGEVKSRLRFYGNSVVNKNEGFGVVCLLNKKESYRFESPDLKVGGLFLGTAYVDYDGKADLHCPQTNMSCRVEFNKKKSMFSRGKRRSLDAQIIYDNPETGRKEVLYEIEGTWDEVINCTNTRTGETEVLFDTATWKSAAPDRIPDPPLEKQWPMESQVVWKDVTVPLRNKDWDKATDQKKVVEDYQRKLAKERKEKDIKWRGRLYTLNEKGEWIANKLNKFEPYQEGEDLDRDQKIVEKEHEKWTDLLSGRVGDEDEKPYTPSLIELYPASS